MKKLYSADDMAANDALHAEDMSRLVAELARLRSVCRWAAERARAHPALQDDLRNAASGNWSAVPREALEEK